MNIESDLGSTSKSSAGRKSKAVKSLRRKTFGTEDAREDGKLIFRCKKLGSICLPKRSSIFFLWC